MSDNVGLSTPRGSGTSGYVQRNLAHLRARDSGAPYPPRDSDSLRQHRQRKPDQGILDHDRKREVEIKVFELRDRLEDEGVDEEEIEDRCAELRKRLLAEASGGGRSRDRDEGASRGSRDRDGKGGGGGGGPGSGWMGPPPPRKMFKAHQVHEMADAKIKESERLRQALKISKDYEEGGHWRKQEERLKNSLERDASGK